MVPSELEYIKCNNGSFLFLSSSIKDRFITLNIYIVFYYYIFMVFYYYSYCNLSQP